MVEPKKESPKKEKDDGDGWEELKFESDKNEKDPKNKEFRKDDGSVKWDFKNFKLEAPPKDLKNIEEKENCLD